MGDFTKGALFTLAGIAGLILFAAIRERKKPKHRLVEVDCSLCANKFLVVTSGHYYHKCPNCELITIETRV